LSDENRSQLNVRNEIHATSAANTQHAFRLYQTHICETLTASGVTWVAMYRGKFGREMWATELLDDWKIMDSIFPSAADRAAAEARGAYLNGARKGGVDPQAVLALKEAGVTRVRRLHEAVAREEWEGHWWCEQLLKEGVGERMIGTYTLTPIAESHLLVDRAPGEPPFSESDADRLYELLCDFPRIHHALMLERGLAAPAQRPFSPREREVVQHLLGPMREAEIADSLGLSKGATHNYIIEIYRVLQVSGRLEMMQLWLGEIPRA